MNNMKKAELQKLTTEELQKKEKGIKTLIFLFIPIILALLYFGFRDYINGENVDMPISIIAICSIGGLVSLFPELKNVQKELKTRN